MTIGTTSSGAIDNFAEIVAVAKNHPDLSIHVDAAWAGVALACPEYRKISYLDEINKYADSFCTNFHKVRAQKLSFITPTNRCVQWGLTNFDASTIWVRDRTYLTDALDVTPEFLRSKHGDDGTVIDFRNWHLALGRRFRSLKLWFILRSCKVNIIFFWSRC